MRLKLNSNSQYFVIFNQLAKQVNNTGRAKTLSTVGNRYDSSLWREGFEWEMG